MSVAGFLAAVALGVLVGLGILPGWVVWVAVPLGGLSAGFMGAPLEEDELSRQVGRLRRWITKPGWRSKTRP